MQRSKSTFNLVLMLAFSCAALQCLLAQEGNFNTKRSSYTIIYQEEPKNVGRFFRAAVPLEFKRSLDWNDIKTKSAKASLLTLENIGQMLTQSGVGNELMAYWWCRQPDGRFRLDTVAKRGLYSSTAMDSVITAEGLRGNASLADAGLNLIGKSFVLFIVPRNLQSMQEKYDALDRQSRSTGQAERVKREYRGYEGQAEGYLYQLVYDDAAKNNFYENMWIFEDDNSEIKKQKKAAFDNARFQLRPVMKVTAKTLLGSTIAARQSLDENKKMPDKSNKARGLIEAAQSGKLSPKSDEDLLRDWAEEAVKRVFEGIMGKKGEDYPDSGPVNTFPVYESRPVKAKIGKKEGAYREKRYIVFDVREHADGHKTYHRRAVVRAKRVCSNFSDNQLMSTFYSVGGLGLVQPGMVLKPQRELGIGIHALGSLPVSANNPIRDYGLGLETNLSLYFGKLGVDRAPVGLKLGINYSLQSDSLFVQSNSELKANVSRFSVYLRKDFHFLRLFRFGIWGGYGSDTVSEANVKEGETARSVSSTIAPVGIEFGMNIFRGLQAFGHAEYPFTIGSVRVNDKEREDLNWFSLYPDRQGLCLRAGIRMNF